MFIRQNENQYRNSQGNRIGDEVCFFIDVWGPKKATHCKADRRKIYKPIHVSVDLSGPWLGSPTVVKQINFFTPIAQY